MCSGEEEGSYVYCVQPSSYFQIVFLNILEILFYDIELALSLSLHLVIVYLYLSPYTHCYCSVLCSKFISAEVIENYHCNTCKRPTTSRLQSSIHTLPDILILHLQRLVITANGGGKIRTLVKFPLHENLNMQPYTTG
jgi:hypothetical protein